jgi:CRP-like cAMP-binding protein
MGKFASLEKASLTKDWNLEERSALGHFLQEMKMAEKETIFTSKSEDRVLYIIESGKVRLAYENTEIDLTEGDSFGELSLLQSSPKLPGAIALTPCIFWTLTFEKWEDMKRAAPVISLKLVEGICQKMVGLLSHNFQPHQFLNARSPSGERTPTSFGI